MELCTSLHADPPGLVFFGPPARTTPWTTEFRVCSNLTNFAKTGNPADGGHYRRGQSSVASRHNPFRMQPDAKMFTRFLRLLAKSEDLMTP